MKPIRSSNIEAVGYESGALYIQLRSGRVYKHTGVPEDLFRNMISASSPGNYYRGFIETMYQRTQVS